MTRITSSVVTRGLLAAALLHYAHYAGAQNHGDLCNADMPCKLDLFLTCDPTTSRCTCADGGYFHEGVGCRLREASPCQQGRQPCVQNAVCVDDGTGATTCACTEGFQSNSQRRCFLPHAAPCSHDSDQCDPDEYMQCGMDLRCECRDRNQATYVPDLKTCHLRSGSACGAGGVFPGQTCARNSICNPFTQRCDCNAQFYPNRDRLCFRLFGSVCQINAECDASTWQQCDRSCVCADPTNAAYDRETDTCRRLIGANCDPAPAINPQPCVQNSECDWDRRQCRCDAGLTPDLDRMCYLAYNASCTPGALDRCNRGRYMECNPVTVLCECKQSQDTWLDDRDGVCKLKADAACSQTPNSQPCINDATCEPSEGPVPTRCRCDFQLEANEERLCYLGYGRRCDGNNDKCDPGGNMVCDGESNTCGCNFGMWHDVEGGMCKAFLGGFCRRDRDCVRNAECHLEQCVCEEGFEGHNRVQCLKGYGAPCSMAAAECSIDSNLQCIGGLCLCPSGYIPEEGEFGLKCVAGYAYPCNASVGCSAEAGLVCLGAKCDCVAPGEQVYLDGRCGSLAGNGCHLGVGNSTAGVLHCTTNAECVPDSVGGPLGKCQCRSGHVQTLSKTCVARSGSGVAPFALRNLTLLSLASILFLLHVSHT